MNHIRYGIVGLGSIGNKHANTAFQHKGVNFTTLYDNDVKSLKEACEKYEVEAADSLEDFASKVDAALVSVPTIAHLEVGKFLLERGVDVLVEKPIAQNTEDAATLVRCAQENGRILQVGHIERFNPVLAELEKKLSQPKFIEAHRLCQFPNRNLDIGVVLDLMIHDLEIILYLVDSPIESIDAVGIPVLTKREDIANARLRFENGAVANITASRISPENLRKIRVFQEDAYLSLDYQDQSGEIYSKGLLGIQKKAVPVEKEMPMKLELDHFLECSAHRREPKVGGKEASLALEVALKITDLISQQNDKKS